MRRGFTLLELVIVLIILLALTGLLLSGVQKVREAAARMSCSNNLKQHGLAIWNYHDQHNHFPPGTMPNPALPPEQRLSFHVAVVPYVECSNVYSRVAKDEAWDSPKNLAATEGRYRIQQCPAWTSRNEQTAPDERVCVTNYVGVAGVGADAATRPDAPGNGMFGYDRALKKDDVKDGTSSTAMLIETAHDVGPWIRGGPSTVRAVEDGVARFGGTHLRPGGFNVLLADGSVRFTKSDIAPEVLAALATVAGGEEIPPEW
jgi:prepilin-type N-terminal cleavage/methylation domain-containing protein/prepilin-type processing-associated H-X9-DG protein